MKYILDNERKPLFSKIGKRKVGAGIFFIAWGIGCLFPAGMFTALSIAVVRSMAAPAITCIGVSSYLLIHGIKLIRQGKTWKRQAASSELVSAESNTGIPYLGISITQKNITAGYLLRF